MLKVKSLFDFEKKSVFLINFFLILLVIMTFLYDIELKYFFYFNIIFTFILSYFFFKTSKSLSKYLIVTNLFIFFYFLYPTVAQFLTELIGSESYLYILFYSIFISYIFLVFSGHHKDFLGDLKKFSFSLLFAIFLLGMFFGFLFFFINEPVPSFISQLFQGGLTSDLISFLFFSSFLFALTEQMIFSGFLFNVYKNLTSKFDAYFQTSIIFVMFHLLRFEVLVKTYYVNFNDWYLLFITLYYLFLFGFMSLALYLYSFKGKNYSGNFFYPLMLHFAADFGLFLFYTVEALA